MKIPYIMKRCTKCGRWLVANEVNFTRRKDNKNKFRNECKECRKLQSKEYRKQHKEELAIKKKEYIEKNKEWYMEYHRQYREQHRKEKAIRQREYNKTPRGQVVNFNHNNRRRVKEQELGNGITKDQWLEMMKFFDFRCAYSGEVLSKNTRSIDHIVPIDAGGDHMIWNCVPMLRSLNSSKSTKDMEKWYKEQDCYDPSRLQKIYDWQEYAYNKWGKDTQYFNSGDIQIKLI